MSPELVSGKMAMETDNQQKLLGRTNLVILSSDLRKIIRARSNQNKLLFIGLNESSDQELFNQSICFGKFEIFQKLSWKN